MPVSTQTVAKCDDCERDIPEGATFWDFSEYGRAFCRLCFSGMTPWGFANYVFDGDFPHDYECKLLNGRSERLVDV